MRGVAFSVSFLRSQFGLVQAVLFGAFPFQKRRCPASPTRSNFLSNSPLAKARAKVDVVGYGQITRVRSLKLPQSAYSGALGALSGAPKLQKIKFFPVTEHELLNLVRRGECEQLEFKQSSAQFSRAAETLCAFMNGRGGQVLVGVRPDGSVVGQTIADKTFQDLGRVIKLAICTGLQFF